MSALVAACVLLPAAAAGAADDGGKARADPPKALSRAEFDHVRALVKPGPGEAPWMEVKWVTTLWEAHERAAREGKPIVIFTTGGEPLGIC